MIELLSKYQMQFAKEIDLDLLKEKTPDEYKAFLEKKQEIFDLMEEADILAEKLRKNILD